MPGLPDIPLNTFVQRRGETEIDEVIQAAGGKRARENDEMDQPSYAAGVDDALAWVFGMTEQRPRLR
jgi:hypothetical protein